MRVYEGYFNNVDNKIDADDVQMTDSLGPASDEHLFKVIISTIDSLPTKRDEKYEQNVIKMYTMKVLNLLNPLFNIFEISPLVIDYRLFIYDNDKPIVCSINEFKNYLVNYIRKSIDESIQYRNEHQDIVSDKKYQFQYPVFAIGAIFDKTFKYDKTYKYFSLLIDRFSNVLHKYMFCSMYIDDMLLIGMWNKLTVIDDVFNSIFSNISKLTKDNKSLLNLQYIDPEKVNATFIRKAKPYKSYLCIDNIGKLVIVLKLNKDKIAEIIGICIDAGIDENNKIFAKFIPFRFATVDRPDFGSFSYRHIIFSKDWYDSFNKEIMSNDGILNTKELYSFANKIAEDTGSYDSHWNKHSINNVKRDGYFPVLTAIYRFHTHGTKTGNWYLGSPSEILKIYKLYTVKKYKDKLWDDLYLFGTKYKFYIPNGFAIATSTMYQEDKNVNLLYTKTVDCRNDVPEVDKCIVSNSLVVLPMLKLTER